MANVKYRIGVCGDLHLSSKNYGGHVNYPEESLHYFQMMSTLIQQYGMTHFIYTGDFTYGRFNTLEYRNDVENELQKQHKLLDGRLWVVKGNHDSASYGMTEYEYYLERKYFKGSEKLDFGSKLTIDMRDYGDLSGVDLTDGKDHILMTHGYFTFKNSNLPNFGASTVLDDKHDWCGIKFILCGHIHEEHMIKGIISDGKGMAAHCAVHYLPCLARPSYHGEDTPVKGCIDIIDVYDDDTYNICTLTIDLLPIEESFDIARINSEKEHKEALKVNLSDVVTNLNTHKISVGNPEDIIMAREDVDIEYRKKAVELLKSALK